MWLRDIDRWLMDNVLPHQPTHRSYARKLLRSDNDADDIVQDAYARLLALENWQRIDNPHAFTMRMIHNIAVERFRKAGVVPIDQGRYLDALDPADDQPSPEAEAIGRSELQRVADIMETLPARCREALKMRKIEGLPPGKVAENMRISVSTVEKHLAKGLRLLTERLAARAGEQEAGHEEAWSCGTERPQIRKTR